jgi:predicted phosphodiesterase
MDVVDTACRVAVLSDIHGNAVALGTVLSDLDFLGIDKIVVAGDLVGGPNPDEVVDLLVARQAQMIRGNAEKEYLTPYASAGIPERWRNDPRMGPIWWSIGRLGHERRDLLARLPDQLMLDEATAVVHGSLRHVRDSVLSSTSDEGLDEMFPSQAVRFAFTGHTHQPLVRANARLRVVNVGSVGLPTDGDPRACYAVATQAASTRAGEWEVDFRRVAYDIETAVRSCEGKLGDAFPWYTALMERQLRTGHDCFGSWLRTSGWVLPDDLSSSVQEYLRIHQA